MWIFFGKIETKIGCKYCADDVISAILFCQNAFSPQCNWKDVVKKYDGKNRGVDQRRPATPAGECVYLCAATALCTTPEINLLHFQQDTKCKHDLASVVASNDCKWTIKIEILFFFTSHKSTFYPDFMFEKCEFCGKRGPKSVSFVKCENFEIVNFVKNEFLKMWILSKMNLFKKCEFCQKWVFENVNFVKNESLKMWILSQMSLWKCEFCQKWDFGNVNFWIKCVILPQCVKIKSRA